ncbi:hypothetical protein A4X09_0g3144 [Tilletia walkeri]|uniref:Tyrosine specific protein phosphatases domain-containing protein n=1 Tax=Tilletia walkeri TaxID=117179 RepID=A0A8X7NBI6_9BASI|nr:hypothetical protein A4X09_0g3144 [Tilletia walkeri]
MAAATSAIRHQQQSQQPQHQHQHQQPPPLPPHPQFQEGHIISPDPLFLQQQQPAPPTLAQRDAQFAQAVRNAANSGIREWSTLIHLAPLASQYHLSPYSIIKYGPNGSPFPYIPLTMQQPQLVVETMAKQREAERVQRQIREQRAEESRRLAEQQAAEIAQQQYQHPATANGIVSSAQQQQQSSTSSGADNTLATANAHAQATGNPPVKTSDTHPINISTLIPPHLVPIISDSIFSSPQSIGTQMLERGRVAGSVSQPTQNGVSSSTTTAIDETGERQAKRQSSRTPLARTDGGESVEGEDAVEEDGIGLGEKRKRSFSRLDASLLPSASGAVAAPTGLPASSSSDSNFTSTTSTSSAPDASASNGDRPTQASSPPSPTFIRLSCNFDLAHAVCDQPELHNVPAPPDAPHPVIAAQAATSEGARSVCEDPEGAVEAAKNAVASAKAGQHSSGERGAWAEDSQGQSQGDLVPPPTTAAVVPRRIGNLLLSSCPGKKVRLTGPVRGRGAICRSLPLDLLRMRSLGIRALVCCLDDDELLFLGAPWEEYARVAAEAGLEVVRIPIAEGFAPSSVRELDERVGEVIQGWSMQGYDVLVHCRGGVGRAGLFACAWMLKMGLVREGTGRESAREKKRAVEVGPRQRAQTPQRVKNGTATPAVMTSPFLVGRDGPDLADVGMGGIPILPDSLASSTRGLDGDDQGGEEEDADGIRGRNACPSLKAISNLDGVSLSSPVKKHRPLEGEDDDDAAAVVEQDVLSNNHINDEAAREREMMARRQQDVLRTVERLVRTIRTRRSPKAIETAEQVKFLVDYVAFLESAEEERLRAEGRSLMGDGAETIAMDLS